LPQNKSEEANVERKIRRLMAPEHSHPGGGAGGHLARRRLHPLRRTGREVVNLPGETTGCPTGKDACATVHGIYCWRAAGPGRVEIALFVARWIRSRQWTRCPIFEDGPTFSVHFFARNFQRWMLESFAMSQNPGPGTII
jgi:hypothetical protein